MQWMNGNKDSPFTREQLNRIHKSMFDAQNKWVANWKEIRDYINPYLGCFDGDNPNDGDRRDFHMINTNALIASNTFAAGMHNGITSPTRPWMKLNVHDPEVAELEGVRQWCSEITSIMLDVFGRSNYYRETHKFYKELGTFGTAAMMMVDDDETVLRCKTFTIGQYALGTDSTGRIKRFSRNIKMTVAEIVDMFGIDNVPNVIMTAFESKRYDNYHEVKHLILPNKDYEQGKIDKWAMAYTSYYWAKDCEDDQYLDIGGYEEFPVMCARWDTNGYDIYGYGPGWYALGDGKSIQNVDSDVHEGIEKGVRPPMVAPADVMMSGGVNSLPDGVTYYQRDMGDNAVRTAFEVKLNIADAMALIQRKEEVINKHFFVDLFRAIESVSGSGASATEIREMVNEKMSLIGPALDNLQCEFLSNVIDRAFYIIMRAGLGPQPADDVAEIISDKELKVEYISIMAQAQKASGLSAIDQLSMHVANLAQFNPAALDKYDVDESIDQYANALGTPPSIVVSDDRVAQIRQAKQQQQQLEQAQAMAQVGTQAAQGAKTLSETQMGQGSALDTLLGGVQ